MLRNSVSRISPILISFSLFIFIVTAITVVLVPQGALADDGVPVKGNFAVAFTFVLSSSVCGDDTCLACFSNNDFYIAAQGIGDTSRLGTLFFKVQKCFDPSGLGTYNGTFTMTAPNGKDSLTGVYTGENTSPGDAYGFGPFSGELKITRGTGKFDGARGNACFKAVANTNNGTAFYAIEGTVSSPAH